MDLLQCSLRQDDKHPTNVYHRDEFEDEDDVFYGELKRQVLQLTAEDDADGGSYGNNKKPNMAISALKQGRANGSFTQPRCYYNWGGNEDGAVPSWILDLWRRGNGTGVFIPQTVLCRRKNRTKRNKNERETTYKRILKMN